TDLPHALVLTVLKMLLAENVSIRNLKLIIEALAQHAKKGSSASELTEQVRCSLRRQISSDLCDDDGVIRVATLDETLTSTLLRSMSPTGQLAPEPSVLPNIARSIENIFGDVAARRQQPGVVLVPDQLRRPLYGILGSQIPDVYFVAFQEYDPQFELQIVGTISA
ncbi:MAG: FHIPEP family type III secretion protein, partial [Cyanobacteria bacterium J06648_11]